MFSLDNINKTKILINTLIIGGTLLSLGNIVLMLIAFANMGLFYSIVMPFYNWGIISALTASGNIPRLVFGGVVAQVFALFFACAKYLEKRRMMVFTIILINLLGIFLTYTRGIYVGVIAGATVLLYKLRNTKYQIKINLRKLVGLLLVLVSLALVLMFILGRERIILYAFQRILSLEIFSFLKLDSSFFAGFDYAANMQGNSVRSEMMEKLYDLIAKHPFIGSGAGAHIDFRDGKVEMVYHNIISKTGIIGLLIFIMPLINMCFTKTRWDGSHDQLSLLKVVCLAFIVAMFVAAYSNPYSMGAIGMFLYCFCMRLFVTDSFPLKNEEEIYLT